MSLSKPGTSNIKEKVNEGKETVNTVHIIELIGVIVQSFFVAWNIQEMRINTDRYRRWLDRTFLRLRLFNLLILVWCVLWLGWNIYGMMH